MISPILATSFKTYRGCTAKQSDTDEAANLLQWVYAAGIIGNGRAECLLNILPNFKFYRSNFLQNGNMLCV